jgi:hypothetical protein
MSSRARAGGGAAGRCPGPRRRRHSHSWWSRWSSRGSPCSGTEWWPSSPAPGRACSLPPPHHTRLTTMVDYATSTHWFRAYTKVILLGFFNGRIIEKIHFQSCLASLNAELQKCLFGTFSFPKCHPHPVCSTALLCFLTVHIGELEGFVDPGSEAGGAGGKHFPHPARRGAPPCQSATCKGAVGKVHPPFWPGQCIVTQTA